MTESLTVRESSDLENISVTANDAAAMPHMQSALIEWCRGKLARVKAELGDFAEAEKHAFEKGYKTQAHTRMRQRAEKRVTFYEKALGALEAGYCLFPNTELSLFAVRTARTGPKWEQTEERATWNRIPVFHFSGEALPAGKGRYVSSDVPGEKVLTELRDEKNYKGEVIGKEDWNIFQSQDFDEIEFPLQMARPEIMDVTSRAMALQLFDEIGILPPQINTDPVIVGRINDRSRMYGGIPRRISFLISWHVDTKDL